MWQHPMLFMKLLLLLLLALLLQLPLTRPLLQKAPIAGNRGCSASEVRSHKPGAPNPKPEIAQPNPKLLKLLNPKPLEP